MKILVKEALIRSFVEMCEQNTLKSITIKDFLTYAGISKQTFYNYFEDKADLMNSVYEMAANIAMKDFHNIDYELYSGIMYIFEICLKNRRFYTQLAKFDTQNNFLDFFIQHSEKTYLQLIAENYGSQSITETIKYTVRFNCYGAGNIFVDWLKSGMKESPEFMATIIWDSMPVNLRKFLRQNDALTD